MSSTGDSRWDTLNSGDTLTGDGAGSTLNLITSDNNGDKQTVNILPTITNVETLNAQVYHGLIINSQFITGMKNVNLQALQNGKLSMIGVNSKLENINLSNLENNKEQNDVDFIVNADQLSATDDVLNVSLNNVVQGKTAISTIDVKSTSDLGTYETLNIASNGAKTNQIFLNSNSANLGISGGAVEIDARGAKLLATVDATASAGNVKLYNVDAVDATSVKLGDGDDIISINNFNAKTTIDTGAGADLVAIKGTPNITAEKLNNISNAETIRLSGKDATIDFDKLTNGVKNFEVASDSVSVNSFRFDNVAAGSTFKVITNDWLGFSNANGTESYYSSLPLPNNFNLDKYGSTVAALNLNGTKGAATSVTLTNNNANASLDNGNVPTLRALSTDSNDLSLVSTGKYANTITTLKAGSGSATAPATVAIKISGDQDLNVINNLAGNANVKNFNVDATALTGNLEIHGSDATGSGDLAHSDIIKGGAGNDTISTGIQFHGTAGVNGKAASITFKPTISAPTDVFSVDENVSFAIQTATGTTTTYTATVASGDGFVGQNVTVAKLVDFIKTATTTAGAKLTDNYSVVISGNNDHITFTQLSGKEVALNGTAATGFNFTTTVAATSTVVTPGAATTYEPGITAQPEIDGSYDVLTGGAGADKFIFDGSYTDVNARTGANSEKVVTSEITDFKSGEDKLVFMSANANNAGNATNFVTGKVYNTFEAMFNAAIAEFKDTTKTTQYFVGQFGQDTYIQ